MRIEKGNERQQKKKNGGESKQEIFGCEEKDKKKAKSHLYQFICPPVQEESCRLGEKNAFYNLYSGDRKPRPRSKCCEKETLNSRKET